MWGISKDQMMKDARENTEKIFPPVMRKIQSVLPIHIIEEEIPLFVMSNGDYMNGASVILYKDVLRILQNIWNMIFIFCQAVFMRLSFY